MDNKVNLCKTYNRLEKIFFIHRYTRKIVWQLCNLWPRFLVWCTQNSMESIQLKNISIFWNSLNKKAYINVWLTFLKVSMDFDRSSRITTYLAIANICPISESAWNSGLRRNISANIQPIVHMSIFGVYWLVPNRHSGDRYHRIVTLCVYSCWVKSKERLVSKPLSCRKKTWIFISNFVLKISSKFS